MVRSGIGRVNGGREVEVVVVVEVEVAVDGWV